MILWMNAQRGQIWSNFDGSKKGKSCEFGMERDKKILLNIYQEIGRSIFKNAAR